MVDPELVGNISILIIWAIIHLVAIGLAYQKKNNAWTVVLCINIVIALFIPTLFGVIIPLIYIMIISPKEKSINTKATCKTNVKTAESKAGNKRKQ